MRKFTKLADVPDMTLNQHAISEDKGKIFDNLLERCERKYNGECLSTLILYVISNIQDQDLIDAGLDIEHELCGHIRKHGQAYDVPRKFQELPDQDPFFEVNDDRTCFIYTIEYDKLNSDNNKTYAFYRDGSTNLVSSPNLHT